MSADHHSHHHHGLTPSAGAPDRDAQRRALWFALAANAAFLLVEFVGGLAFNSLALLADAAHMLSDVAGLGVALVAQALVSRPSTARHTYGLQRAEVLGGQVNGLVLLAVAAWIVFEAIDRIGEPAAVQGRGVLVIGGVGLLINVVSAVRLRAVQGRSVNMRGAVLHMWMDAAGSVGAMAAAVAVIGWNAEWVDPAVSLLIAALVVWAAVSLLRDTTRVLLEAVPVGVDPEAVEAALLAAPGVAEVHHLHLWSLASDVTALSGHVVLDSATTLLEAQTKNAELKELLRLDLGIDHVTLEVECRRCTPEPTPGPPVTPSD